MAEHLRVWRRIEDDLSFEHARILVAEAIEIAGVVVLAHEGVAQRVDYRVVCGPDWVTREVEVSQALGTARRQLRLEHDGQGAWRVDGRRAPHIQGCTDVDLGVSPATNALPINRLRLDVGAQADLRVAWILFPTLQVVKGAQRYGRIGERRYRFTALEDGVTADLEVDEVSLPIAYGDIWRQIATG